MLSLTVLAVIADVPSASARSCPLSLVPGSNPSRAVPGHTSRIFLQNRSVFSGAAGACLQIPPHDASATGFHSCALESLSHHRRQETCACRIPISGKFS